MAPLIELFWPGLVLAFTLGAVVGGVTVSQAPPSRTGRASLAIGTAACLGGLALAGFEALPGRAGLWLETALLLIGPYLAGCLAGALLGRALRGARPTPGAS